MTNVNGPIGAQGTTYTQTAQTINNNQYFLPVPDSHYQDQVSFSGNAARPTVTTIIQNGTHATANDLQALIGGESYSQLSQSAQLQATFNQCDQIISALYGANPGGQTTIIINQPANDPLAELRGMSQMVSAAIRDAMAAIEQPVESEAQKPEVNKEKIEMAAMALHNAMDGWGTDEKAIMDTLGALTPEEKAHLEMIYAEKYGYGDPGALRNDLRCELSLGEEAAAIRSLNEGSHKNALVSAMALHEAMDGPGTDEETVQTIMSNLSAEELKEVQSVYSQLYGSSLREDIKGDFSAFWDDGMPAAGGAILAAYMIPGVGPIAGTFMALGALGLGMFTDSGESTRNAMMSKLNAADAVQENAS